MFIHLSICLQYQEESTFSRGTKKKEGDIRKADEAEELYKSWVAEANGRQRELENTKAKILVELRQLVYQCDMTMKAVSFESISLSRYNFAL